HRVAFEACRAIERKAVLVMVARAREVAGELAHESHCVEIRRHGRGYTAACEKRPRIVERALCEIEPSRPSQRAAKAHERVAGAEAIAGPAVQDHRTAKRPNPLRGIAELVQHSLP